MSDVLSTPMAAAEHHPVGLIVTDDSSIEPLRTSFETDWAAGTAF